jgi:hypothetical protein
MAAELNQPVGYEYDGEIVVVNLQNAIPNPQFP